MALTELGIAEPRAPARREAPDAADGTERDLPRGYWRQLGLAFAAFTATLAGLHVVLQGVSWGVVAAVFAAIVMLATGFTRRAVRTPFVPPAVGLLVGLGLLTLAYAADTAILGVIPSLDTFARFTALGDAGVLSIMQQRAPAAPELGLVMLVAVLAIGCAWLIELLVAIRSPALLAAPLGAVLVIPVVVKPGLVDPLWFVVTAVLYLALLRVGRRRDSTQVTVLTGAAVLVGALLAPLALPDVDARVRQPTGGLSTGINPFISLGDDLRRGDPTLALTYTTSSTQAVYLRLTTLQDFDGQTWEPLTGAPAPGTGLDAFAPPRGLDDGVWRGEVEARVEVQQVSSRWLPAPYPATSVEGLDDSWFWDPESLAVRSTTSSTDGAEYTVRFLELDPSDEQLQGGGVRDVPEGALAVPEDLPEIIVRTASEATESAATPYEQAIALQRFLRSAPFAYSEDTPVEEGFDGSGIEALAVFLEEQVGYCVHYASAMAVMARTLGIPARIAVGFQPGEVGFVDGQAEFEVSTDDLHAWPELYIDGVGWLRFEPTPGRGAVPDYGSAPVDDPATPEDESEPTAAPTAAPTNEARPDIDEQVSEEEAAERQVSTASGIALWSFTGLLLLFAVPAGVRAWVRAGRVRRMRAGLEPAAAAWEEVRDTARDVGWSAPESETPREFAARLEPVLHDDARALGVLRSSIERAAYGRPDAGVVTVDELRAVRRAILRSHSARERLRAFVLPVSLVARWNPDA